MLPALCFLSVMRWRAEESRCTECDFAWNVAAREAVSLIANSPERIRSLLEGSERVTQHPAPRVWSPNGYLWHLVDVLRIGAERLLTTSVDPAAGIPCWNENALAEVRQYDSLSPRVGLVVYEAAVAAWVAIAKQVRLQSSVEHPQFGMLTAEDIIRRNAHEVKHHELDIRKGLKATAG